jgi:hypothetical protein
MATLDTEERNELKDSQFAYIDRDGGRHLPVHDEEHARNAVSRFGQTEFESKDAKRKAARKVLAAARKHGVDVSDDSDVSKASKG